MDNHRTTMKVGLHASSVLARVPTAERALCGRAPHLLTFTVYVSKRARQIPASNATRHGVLGGVSPSSNPSPRAGRGNIRRKSCATPSPPLETLPRALVSRDRCNKLPPNWWPKAEIYSRRRCGGQESESSFSRGGPKAMLPPEALFRLLGAADVPGLMAPSLPSLPAWSPHLLTLRIKSPSSSLLQGHL